MRRRAANETPVKPGDDSSDSDIELIPHNSDSEAEPVEPPQATPPPGPTLIDRVKLWFLCAELLAVFCFIIYGVVALRAVE